MRPLLVWHSFETCPQPDNYANKGNLIKRCRNSLEDCKDIDETQGLTNHIVFQNVLTLITHFILEDRVVKEERVRVR